MELPGIGPWSAALVLLRGFGRLEVFPPGDSGAQRGLNALLRLRTPESLARVVDRFGEYRGYLYFCGLGGSLLAKGLIHAAPRPVAH
jgi:DNA-3-methyladenine glycosylase II